MKKFVCLLLFLFCMAMSLSAGEKNKYSKVKIFFDTKEQVAQLAQTGLIFDHVERQKEPGAKFSYTTILDQSELAILSNSNQTYTIITPDVVEAYKEHQRSTSFNKSALNDEDPLEGFELGSLGGFYTFDEMVAELDSMYMLYPEIITQKDSIGTTHEGRPIWMVKISDNPNVDEDEPEVLYNAMHHAREPGSMMTLMYFMYYLLENYGTDPEVTYLVNNRQLFFVPIVNPDGYEFNREMEPVGGYLWRKNKRDNNSDGIFSESNDGVDLNRNYAYEWGYNDFGSSPNMNSTTYRGPGPFSEPETQAIGELCLDRNFKIALNYHTYGNWLIYPWGYIDSYETPDSIIFRQLAKEMTKFNNYVYGTTDQTVNYNVNGDSDDWMYGEQVIKNKIFSMTPEIGTRGDNFWPDPSRIYPQVQENVYPNLFAAWAAGGAIRFLDHEISYSSGIDYLEAGMEYELTFDLTNVGLDVAANVSIQLFSDDPFISVDQQSILLDDLASQLTITSGPLSFSVSPAARAGYVPEINLGITQDDVTILQPIQGLIVGKPVAFFADGFEVANNKWTFENPWARTNEKPHTDLFSFSDSPFGNYADSSESSLYLKPLNFSKVNSAYLEFWTCWDIEDFWDFGQVQASIDSINWTSLSGLYTNPASGLNDIQQAGSHGYDGTQKTWIKEKINLNDYINQGSLYLRFNLQSDYSENHDGWYIDDVKIVVYSDSLLSSIDKELITSNKFKLHQNYPNPFNPTTHIRFELQRQAQVKIEIFNSLGKKVCTLINEQRSAGKHTLLWNGTNNAGSQVSSGVYFYVMKSGSYQSRKKLLLLR